jgi:hypothetical protein
MSVPLPLRSHRPVGSKVPPEEVCRSGRSRIVGLKYGGRSSFQRTAELFFPLAARRVPPGSTP